MKKAIFTLAVFAMAFGNVGFAQNEAHLKSTEKEIIFRHYGLRNDDIRPSEAIWSTTTNESFKTTYTYDEYDYWLVEELTEMNLGDGWIPAYMITYEYDFSGNVLEANAFESLDGEWVEDERALYTYGSDEMEIVYQMMIDGQWENSSKEVYNYNGDVTTVLIWAWNGNTWSSSRLNTYTRSGNTIELLMQYMQGGAWQNEEKCIYTLDFDENILEILVEFWVNNTMWEFHQKNVYHYNGGVYTSMTVEVDNNLVVEQYDYNYVDDNATHGECKIWTGGSQLVPGDGNLEMAYNYNAACNEYYDVEVDVTYIDVTTLKEHAQTASFKVYPNPVKDEINIQAESFAKAEIYSVTGQKLMESNVNTFNVSALSQGVYLLKVYDLDDNSETQKIVVK